MKRLLLVLGFASLLDACGGKNEAPGLAPFPTGTGGGTSDTGGRSHTGGRSGTSTGTSAGGTGTGVGGTGTGVGGVTGVGGTGTSIGGTGNPGTNTGGTSAGTNVGGTTSADTSTAATGGVDQLALLPVVTILSPAATTIPSDDADAGTDAGADINVGPVLIDTPVEVRCQASKATAPGAIDIAASSVQLSMKPTGGTTTQKAAGPVSDSVNTYSASFPITDLPSGSVDIACMASDSATPARTNSATISTFIDHGPIISEVLPAASAVLAIKSPGHFEFKVTPKELVPGDIGAQIGTVSLKVTDVTIPIQPDPARPGYYMTDVFFGDATKFPQIASGNIAVEIDAANKRSNPKPAIAKDVYSVILDGDPPVITILSPPPSNIISSLQVFSFSVTDPLSGVDPRTVVVNLGTADTANSQYPFSPDDPSWTMTQNGKTATFGFLFDRTKFAKTDSQINVSVNASDMVGNQSTSNVVLYYLDDQPPYVSLDPPNVRYLTKNGTQYNCSSPFDPIGSAVPNGNAIVNSFEFYRAFAEDVTNGKASQNIFYYAGIDPTKVQLFFQSDPSKGIVYDKDGDGVCDSIVEDVRLGVQQPHLMPVTEHGSPAYTKNDKWVDPPPVDSSICVVQPSDVNPDHLCAQKVSDMTMVLHQQYAGQAANDAAVYAVQVQAGLQCTGVDMDISKIVQEGWVCVAASATDSVGNTGISAPLALCFDDETTPFIPSCVTGSRHSISTQPAPNCIAYDANLDGNSKYPGLNGFCVTPSKSAVGDLDVSSNTYVPYDTGNPVPYVIVAPP